MLLMDLEVWAACQAAGIHLNLIQHSNLWSSRSVEVNQDNFTIMVLEEGIVYCDLMRSGEGCVAATSAGCSLHGELWDLSVHQKNCTPPRTWSQNRKTTLPMSNVSSRTLSKAVVDAPSRPVKSVRAESHPAKKACPHGRKAVNLGLVAWKGSLKSIGTGLCPVMRSSLHGKSSVGSVIQELNCEECEFEGDTTQALYRHMKGEHPYTRPYQCIMYGMWFNTPHDQRVHMNSVHAWEVLQCDHCNFTMYNQSRLMNHKRMHSNKKLQCDYCDISLSSKGALDEHIKRHFDTNSYPCPKCDKEFASALSRKIHVTGKHRPGFMFGVQCSF